MTSTARTNTSTRNTTTRNTTTRNTAGAGLLAALTVLIALLLGACSDSSSLDATSTTDRPERPTPAQTSSPDDADTADTADTADNADDADDAATTPSTVPASTTSSSSSNSNSSGSNGTSTPSQPAPQSSSADAASGVEYWYCADNEYPNTEWGIVTSAPANSSSGTLPVYAGPDMAEPVWSESFVGDTLAFAYVTDFAGCVHRSDGMIFWAVWLDEGDFGWVDSYRVAPSAQPGWADDTDPGMNAGSVPGNEEPDVHADCLYLASQPSICVTVYGYGDGTITYAEFPSTDAEMFAALDCVYGGDGRACAALASIGQDVNNYGLGNTLTQAPSEFLRQDCDTLGYNNPQGALACAELMVRHTQP